MLHLYCSRNLMPLPIRVVLKSSILKSSAVCFQTFKPVEVSYSKSDLNLFFKRNYIRQNKGGRQRRQDGLPEGFELVYQARYNVGYIGYLCLCYFTLGFTSWYIIKSYAFKNNEESKELEILDRITITKGSPSVTGVLLLLAVTAAIALQCAFKTPRRMYVKDNELIAVIYKFLGPYKKKLVKCNLDEIRPLAPVGLMPWRGMEYDLKGIRLFFFPKNFRSYVPKSRLIGVNKPLRTRLNDFFDKVKKWTAFS